MFCGKCGAMLQDDAMYCTNCGTKVEKANDVKEKEETDDVVLYTLKPTFKLWYKLIPKLFWSTALIWMYTFIICHLEDGDPLSSFTLGVIVYILCLIIICIRIVLKKKEYAGTYYSFYNSKVVFENKFLGKVKKEIQYRYIREIVKKQSLFQRLFKISNIYLYTYSNNICIYDVLNGDEIYEKIKSIIKN